MTELRKIERALISVSDKTGIVEFATALREFDVRIISTGGTSNVLRKAGIEVTDVSEVTGFPELMDGRVKTLHPKIHGAFLALRDNKNHLASLKEHGIEPIDLVVVNLYPFEQTIAKEGVSLEEAVENIDIGGPSMIRSASKNWRDVAVISDPRLYGGIVDELRTSAGSLSITTRKRLAALAYTRTASYDLAISSYLAGQLTEEDLAFLEPLNPLEGLMFYRSDEAAADASGENLPAFTSIDLSKIADLRYGENPHQKAALYSTHETGGTANAEQLHGKEMSFNNYIDAEAAWNLVKDLDGVGAAIIKHTNPSGVGLGATNFDAYSMALSTDPVSAFGGIVAFNRKVDMEVAKAVIEVFSEVIVAPDYDPHAVEIFRSKKNLRVLRVTSSTYIEESEKLEYKQISGGFLVQNSDSHRLEPNGLKFVTERQPTNAEIKAMLFAWNVCKHVKSNAIVLANERQTLGVGAGQMNRIDSIRIAAMRAERFGLPLKGAILASDAFFPFRDNVDEAARLGIAAIIQPGGSIKDDESIKAANEHGIAMVFTGIRHFKH
jgi:phosphoribosylaminoimidazolecarboxamide formyltransferase / IMP cyclohydrolase